MDDPHGYDDDELHLHEPVVFVDTIDNPTMATAVAAVAGLPKQQGPKPPLRRATYVNVDKLVRSQYDIDSHRFASELAKLQQAKTNEGELKAEEHENATAAAGGGGAAKGVGVGGAGVMGRLPGGGEGGGGARSLSSPTPGAAPKQNAWAGTNLSVLPGTSFRSPLTHAKYHHQSRLQPPRDGFNLCVLVGKVELVVDKYRVDGSRVLVAEVEVGDETGAISLRARDEQIDVLRRVSEQEGGAIVLRNCTMELYQGKHLRLAVSKWGKMTPYPDGIQSTPPPPASMNRELNFSLVDLNIIAMTKVPNEPVFPMPVATVHHKHPKQQQQHSMQHHLSPKHHHFDDSPSRGGTPRNRSRSHGGGGLGHYPIHQNAHQKKKKDDWQQQQQQPSMSHHRGGAQQHRPRSGSHGISGSQYLLPHQTRGGSSSPPLAFVPPQMHYPAPSQYNDGTGRSYSYPPLQGQGDQQQGGGGVPPPGSPHSRPSPQQQQQQQQQFLPADHYKRQQALMLQQYDLQQRHAHQMAMLQQHQESQRRMLEQQYQQQQHHQPVQGGQQQQHSSLIPGLSRVGSDVSGGGGEYPSVPPPPPPATLQMRPGVFPPPTGPNHSPTQPPMPLQPEYPYASLMPTFQGGGGDAVGQQQQQPPPGGSNDMGGGGGPPSYATIVSPPMSPMQGPSHPVQALPQYSEVDGQYDQEKQK
mmetsp:Transcript_3454/g.7191  ORF Transcript_3454/g.7191 Transcript_3454/m.7191 type:complete len:694 (+) Transcript_3454:11-2092(+)